MDAVIAVVPGNSAVISLVLALMLATGAVPTVKLMVPMDASQVGIEDSGTWVPFSDGSVHAARLGLPEDVIEVGAHNSYCVPLAA